jgi:hypothetical protein
VIPPVNPDILVTIADHRLAASSALEIPEGFLRTCVLASRRRRPFEVAGVHRRNH